MARPESNTVDYFPHLIGDGKKILFIENKYGNDGYATWYKVLEKLAKTDYHFLNLNEEEEIIFLAARCRVPEERLLNIINDLVRIGAFDKDLWKIKIIWCQKFIDEIQGVYKKRNNECITLPGLRELLQGLGLLKQGLCTLQGAGNPQSKVKESKVKESKGERSVFTPPSLLEITDFFKEKMPETFWSFEQCGKEANKFFNHYESKNWFVGKNKMVKWKNAAAGWIDRDQEFKQEKNKSSKNVHQTTIPPSKTGFGRL